MMRKPGVVIYGAGGHGIVVLDALERAGRRVVVFLDDDPERWGELGGRPVRGPDALSSLEPDAEVVVAVGDGAVRERLTARVLEAGRELAVVIHPSATIGRDATVGAGAMILAQAAVNPRARIGRCAIVNTGAVVDHDTLVGGFAHIAPGARLAGGVRVGLRALVGIGASVLPNVEIGDDAVVGAGAAVTKNVGPGATVVGVPARQKNER
jgi:sugar O-acyltransferase (sialic acid O-acetyltransferase NeuD family)